MERPFGGEDESIVGRWVAGVGEPRFTTLKSEEHTAQINRELAKRIEDRFRGLGGSRREDELRIEGVNVLSSTTTFEMGINIGDLQKILLRNAPPSSANYIQRVGRAGRGVEKNSIAVTLCRRTKYDADSWEDPSRLMSGEIRAPTVFLTNRVIAQRHFNALVFALFLRQRIRDQQLLGPMQQKIRLEAFLSMESRAGIPEAWFHMNSRGKHLDFLPWLEQQTAEMVVGTTSGQGVVGAVSGWDSGKQSATKDYRNILESISAELAALLRERDQLFKAGSERGDIDQAVKNLLGSDVISVLAKRGFLPRYAFPLDVVTLETGRTRWSGDSDVELSRDRGLAIAEFAPGAQVVAHKKVFTSAGLYIVSDKDRPERHWYSRCPGCDQIRVARIEKDLEGECKVCGRAMSSNSIHPYVSPNAFSVRLDEKLGSPRFRRSTLIRQKQTLTHFIDHVDPASLVDMGLFKVACSEAGSLFRYNLGPANEGFMLCNICGCSEPLHGYKSGRPHKRLRSFSGSMECRNDHVWTKRTAYGHEFKSYCLVARPTKPLVSIESLAFALQRGVCATLQVEPSDIGVSWRVIGDKQGQPGSEVVLYDQVPGGAGFAKEASENWPQVIEAALGICKTCTCDAACYECLKSYGNQAHHDRLDRNRVLEFLAPP